MLLHLVQMAIRFGGLFSDLSLDKTIRKPVCEEVDDRGNRVELDRGKSTLVLLLVILTLFILLLIMVLVVMTKKMARMMVVMTKRIMRRGVTPDCA